jgi:hypothetical protein
LGRLGSLRLSRRLLLPDSRLSGPGRLGRLLHGLAVKTAQGRNRGGFRFSG